MTRDGQAVSLVPSHAPFISGLPLAGDSRGTVSASGANARKWPKGLRKHQSSSSSQVSCGRASMNQTNSSSQRVGSPRERRIGRAPHGPRPSQRLRGSSLPPTTRRSRRGAPPRGPLASSAQSDEETRLKRVGHGDPQHPRETASGCRAGPARRRAASPPEINQSRDEDDRHGRGSPPDGRRHLFPEHGLWYGEVRDHEVPAPLIEASQSPCAIGRRVTKSSRVTQPKRPGSARPHARWNRRRSRAPGLMFFCHGDRSTVRKSCQSAMRRPGRQAPTIWPARRTAGVTEIVTQVDEVRECRTPF